VPKDVAYEAFKKAGYKFGVKTKAVAR